MKLNKLFAILSLSLFLTIPTGCNILSSTPPLQVTDFDEQQVEKVLETNITPVNIKDKVNDIANREIDNANNNIQETINSKAITCQDGNSFIINNNGVQEKVRLLLTTVGDKDDEARLGNTAAEFVCKLIKDSNEVMLIKDKEARNETIYGEKLRWILVDNKLVQHQLAENGLVIGLYDSNTGKTKARNSSDRKTHYYNEVVDSIQDVNAIFGT